jgi:hypothetical protein
MANEYALLLDGVLIDIRTLDSKPQDIPHKKFTWHNVVREYGTPFVGLEKGNWVIRTKDPATLPPMVPLSITPRQCRLILEQQGLLDQVEAVMLNHNKASRITWEYALEFRRDDPLLNELAGHFNLTKEQIDQFFIAAAQL